MPRNNSPYKETIPHIGVKLDHFRSEGGRKLEMKMGFGGISMVEIFGKKLGKKL